MSNSNKNWITWEIFLNIINNNCPSSIFYQKNQMWKNTLNFILKNLYIYKYNNKMKQLSDFPRKNINIYFNNQKKENFWNKKTKLFKTINK